ncbi:hypothetical protein DSO57_1011100 [Entomophthora muscae]|uniref:Uncharacterized protein n=2 Tax=Entomophthora muscae TaxID=34485 RepID=A0ACC2T6D8_9FUNG|nr:hypothetical protein DSO57_1034705 [Entomophthora muscae]KAJ9070180.1 hypothetical protein DSO57_1011100 [Entomophthora muscae]
MKFFKVACLGASGCMAAAIVNSGDVPFSTYISSSEYIVSPSKGVLNKLTAEILATETLPFTREDYEIIIPQLSDPETLGPLFLNNEVNLDLYGISIPPDEAKDAILVLSEQYKKAIARRINESIRYKSQLPTKADGIKRIHATLDRLAQVDDLEQTLMTAIGRVFDDHPEYIDYTKILVKALPDTFEHDVLSYMRDFFREANSYNMDVANNLRLVLKTTQTQYDLLPKDYYDDLATVVSHPEDSYIFK